MTINETEPRVWGNNVNTIMQEDMRGIPQNIAYYDADDGMQIGGNDPRITILMQEPLNLFRPHVYSDFNEQSLDSKWRFQGANGGYLTLQDGCAKINSGNTNAGGGTLDMPNVPVYIAAGCRIYFYLTTSPNGNLSLEFGVKTGGQYLRFQRVEDNTAQHYFAQTNNGTTANTDTGVAGNSVRRLFCIDVKASQVDYYISNDGGQLQLVATHTNTITGAPVGNAYISFYNRYPAQRQVAMDAFYGILLR